MTVHDDKLLARLRGLRVCEVCRQSVISTDPAHIKAKGLGGGHRIDLPQNVVAACRMCHRSQHDGHIPLDRFREAVCRREGGTVAQVKEYVDFVDALPKGSAVPPFPLPAEEPAMQDAPTSCPQLTKALDALLPKDDAGKVITTFGPPVGGDASPTLHRHSDGAPPSLGYPPHPVALLFPRPTAEELAALEKDILADGVQQPIWLWKGQLMDGLSRQAICLKHKLDCPTLDLGDISEEEASRKAFEENVRSRPKRSLNPTQRAVVAAGFAEILVKIGIAKRTENLKNQAAKEDDSSKAPKGADEGTSGNTHHSAEQAAGKTGASTRTTERVMSLKTKVPPEIFEAMKDGTLKATDVEKVVAAPAKSLLEALDLVRSKKVKTMFAAIRKLSNPPRGGKFEPDEEEKEQTVADLMAEVNTLIEKFCRKLMKIVNEEMPKDTWLDHLNVREAALKKFQNGCETLRSAKCVCLCPKCDGTGCHTCRDSGRITAEIKRQIPEKK